MNKSYETWGQRWHGTEDHSLENEIVKFFKKKEEEGSFKVLSSNQGWIRGQTIMMS